MDTDTGQKGQRFFRGESPPINRKRRENRNSPREGCRSCCRWDLQTGAKISAQKCKEEEGICKALEAPPRAPR